MNEEFVDVIFRSQSTASKESKHERKFYGEWIDKGVYLLSLLLLLV